MRRLIALGALAATLALQAPAPAASTGRIEGKVVNETTGQPQRGVKLTLSTGTSSGDSDIAGTTRSDSHGRYVFDDLATGSDRFYALDARYDGGLFAGRPVTLPSDTSEKPVIESTLRVWDTTAEPGVMAIRRDDMFVVSNEEGVGVIESVTFANTSQMAYIGRGAEMAGEDASGVSFVFALPDAAAGFTPVDSTLDIPVMVPVEGVGAGATIAIPPGENRATFSYAVEGDGGTFDLSRPALYPILEMSIFAAEPLEIRSNRLVSGEAVDLEGKKYERWSTEDPIDAGDPLQAIAVASGRVPIVPLVAAAAALVAFLTVMTLLFRRRRTVAVAAPNRDELLERVAKLDLSFESGEIDRDRWDEQRGPLVERLRELEGSKR
jgi:hypothetical protein